MFKSNPVIDAITTFGNQQSETFISIFKATLILAFSVAGNALGETLSCQSRRILKNMYAKHILTLFMIYFTIDFAQSKNHIMNPLYNVTQAIFVWIAFHLFSHMDLTPTLIVATLLMVIMFNSNYSEYIEYLKKHNKSDENTDKLYKVLKKSEKILYRLIVAITLGAYLIYLYQKKLEYKKAFRIDYFLLGVSKCKNYII